VHCNRSNPINTRIELRSINKEGVLNKNDLAAKVADAAGLSKADAGRAVDAVFDCITASLKGGQEVRIFGFGTFHVAQRAAMMGRNPATQEPIQIPASKQAKFKAGKGLKDSLN
jgi:DNA-binding protein HU-beta